MRLVSISLDHGAPSVYYMVGCKHTDIGVVSLLEYFGCGKSGERADGAAAAAGPAYTGGDTASSHPPVVVPQREKKAHAHLRPEAFR